MKKLVILLVTVLILTSC
ncbi:lipoprotein [bacterium]|nr:lipoprotein [bacterium]